MHAQQRPENVLAIDRRGVICDACRSVTHVSVGHVVRVCPSGIALCHKGPAEHQLGAKH
jgi:hypothetical protein